MPNKHYYAIVQEIENGDVKQDLWQEAFARACGNRSIATSIYISLRAEQIYRGNDSVLKRAAISVWQTSRGKRIAMTTLIVVMFSILMGAQPFLRDQAAGAYKMLYAKVKQTAVVGKNERFLVSEFGLPKNVKSSGDFVAYIYNPSSFFYLQKKRFELRFFVSPDTGLITGWVGNSPVEGQANNFIGLEPEMLATAGSW